MGKSKRIGLLLSVLTGAVILFSSVQKNGQSTEMAENQEEIEAIRATVQLYVDGITFSNTDKLDAAFHEEWHMTGFFEDGVYQRFDRERFISMIGSNTQRTVENPAFEGGIVDVYHYGKTAVVKVRVENERVIFTDHLSLLKINGEWTIVHKIWDTELQNS